MFNAALFEEIASETNRYAEDKISQKPDPKWKRVTGEEIKAYIGVKIITGIVSVPNTLYFTKDTLFHSTGISDKFPEIGWIRLDSTSICATTLATPLVVLMVMTNFSLFMGCSTQSTWTTT